MNDIIDWMCEIVVSFIETFFKTVSVVIGVAIGSAIALGVFFPVARFIWRVVCKYVEQKAS